MRTEGGEEELSRGEYKKNTKKQRHGERRTDKKGRHDKKGGERTGRWCYLTSTIASYKLFLFVSPT